MSLGYSTQVIDGQRNTFPTAFAYQPTQYGPQTTGVPQVSPTMPPFMSGGVGMAGASLGAGMVGVGGYGTADNNAQVAAAANANPHNWKVSPVWWAVGFLLAGILMLNGTSFRKTVLQSAEEHAHVGSVKESASESV